jgi:hypothetical protein
LHDAIWQVPVAHVGVAFARLQATPHAPQSVSVTRLVSHPLLTLPSQLPVPAAQLAQPQTPAEQLGVPLGHEHA